MSGDTLPNDFEIRPELTEMGVAVSPSELHGLLSGWIAAGAKPGSQWIADVLVDPDLSAPAADSQLAQLLQVTQTQFKDPEFGFQILSPDTDEPLNDRAAALFEWCQGFVAGFALGGAKTDAISDDAQEALNDLVTIARTRSEPTPDADEDSLAEIEEYVRVAALLLHSEVAMAQDYRRSLN